MSARLLNSALKLSESERILLAEQIWDSLATQQRAPALSESQISELDRRLARLEKTGVTGSSWDDVKNRLKKRKS
jgi:putative addiction module component (TIGR02574 family)